MRVPTHELAVAFIIGGIMGVVGYYATRKISPPVERAVARLGA